MGCGTSAQISPSPTVYMVDKTTVIVETTVRPRRKSSPREEVQVKDGECAAIAFIEATTRDLSIIISQIIDAQENVALINVPTTEPGSKWFRAGIAFHEPNEVTDKKSFTPSKIQVEVINAVTHSIIAKLGVKKADYKIVVDFGPLGIPSFETNPLSSRTVGLKTPRYSKLNTTNAFRMFCPTSNQLLEILKTMTASQKKITGAAQKLMQE